ncbi:MAG: 3-hydroxyacyl-CoA dehydrogenase NAD-binding domain-containing protein [Rhodanobacter sp.]
MSVSYGVIDGIAVLTMDSPPVNDLDLAMRRGLVECLARAVDDNLVKAIVVTGGASAFSGGEDIQEFSARQTQQAPTLAAVVHAFERSTKLVVASIAGMALGGGLELALGLNYRVAAKGALVGLPGVKLGILPGAGGSQRFPRAVGLETALNMILSGTVVTASELAKTRLFYQVVDGDVLQAAMTLAAEKAHSGEVLPRVRDWKIDHPSAEGFLCFARARIAASPDRCRIRLMCLDTVEAAVKRSFDEGVQVEREAISILVNSPVSKALRHAFLSEQAAAAVVDLVPAIRPQLIRKIGVIGAGTMGVGITMTFLDAGIPVTLLEMSQAALDRGLVMIRGSYERGAAKGKLTKEQVEQRIELIRPTLAYADLSDADLIVEAVFEQYEAKEAVFKRMDEVAKFDAILATNTSTLDVNAIAGFTSRPHRVLGTHFFSPANVMKLLEVVRGDATGMDVLSTVLALAKRIGKTAVVSGVCDGFIGNRMIEQYVRQAGFLLDEGALPEQVDRVAENFGFAMGPFRMSDLAGNDISWAIRRRRAIERPEITYSSISDELCELGRFGQKVGKGWYDYKPADRHALRSGEVDALVERHSAALGIKRRQISDEEIIERLVYALVNEGARVLEDGIAGKASDIDVVYLAGYGFPAWRGGPMFYADSVGLCTVLMAVRQYGKGYHGEAWEPAPLLLRLAEAGKSFNG